MYQEYFGQTPYGLIESVGKYNNVMTAVDDTYDKYVRVFTREELVELKDSITKLLRARKVTK